MAEQDRLLILEEISEKTRLPENSVRYKKHRGEMDFIFRLGKRLVAYESDVDSWIRDQRQAQRSA
jgi:predicted DNA-binding transcriptional regulator AlpA